MAKPKARAKAKSKAAPKRVAAKPKAKAKAKAKPAAKAMPVSKAKPAAKAKPKAKPQATQAQPSATVARRAQIAAAADAANTAGEPRVDPAAQPPSIAPFTIDETPRGGFALLLVDLGIHATDGYIWEAVARRVAAAARLRNLTYDAEPRMFCAYAPEHATLGALGRQLADLYRAPDTLAGVVAEVSAATTNE